VEKEKNKIILSLRIGLLLLLVATGKLVFAQEKTAQPAAGQIEGIIFDKATKERIARVVIFDVNSGKSWYDDLKGEFKIDAQSGDRLVFSKEDYKIDTVIVKGTESVIAYMERIGIPLKEVTIRDSLHTPMQRLIATRKEYSKAYGSSSFSDPLSFVPGGGAGINIDAIYNSLSRSGRNAAHLRELIQGDYQQNVIDFRFNKTYVSNITKLKGQDLADFMIKYRPSYYLVSTYSEYEFISYIRTSARRYLRNKRFFALPPLRPPQS
jgi:hypothetical protein